MPRESGRGNLSTRDGDYLTASLWFKTSMLMPGLCLFFADRA